MTISKFGQYVKLTIKNEGDSVIFESDSLRIDFDVRHIDGFSRCKIDIYNLAPATIKAINNGKNYASIAVAKHDEDVVTIINRFFISNALEVPSVPHSITSIFTFSSIRLDHLERQIDTIVAAPSLRRIISELGRLSEFTGQVIYKDFPSTMVDHVPPRPLSHQKGSFQACLEKLSEQFGFNVYTEDDNLIIVYKPNARNVVDTSMYKSSGDIKLSTNDMRNNPKIGPATLSFDSNLNRFIKPSTILDISNLLYADVDISQTTLELAENFIRDKVAGFTNYQALSVQHKGSNFANKWVTSCVAVSPTVGNNMPTESWYK